MAGVASFRRIARRPPRESTESFWTKGCLASVFGVPAFFPFARFSERGHVPPDEAAAAGARVCGGLGGAHAPHRKQVRARPRIVVLAPLVSEASREASARRVSRKESWHPAHHRICAPDLTRALPLLPSQAQIIRGRGPRPLADVFGPRSRELRRGAHARRAQRRVFRVAVVGRFRQLGKSLPRRREDVSPVARAGGAGGGRSDLSRQERQERRGRERGTKRGGVERWCSAEGEAEVVARAADHLVRRRPRTDGTRLRPRRRRGTRALRVRALQRDRGAGTDRPEPEKQRGVGKMSPEPFAREPPPRKRRSTRNRRAAAAGEPGRRLDRERRVAGRDG